MTKKGGLISMYLEAFHIWYINFLMLLVGKLHKNMTKLESFE
jgi:hypothetical protein